jgi:hypothetical protein
MIGCTNLCLQFNSIQFRPSSVQNFVQSLANAVTRRDTPPKAGPVAAPASARASNARATSAPAVAPESSPAAAPPGLHPGIVGTIGEEFAHILTNAMELIVHAAANPRSFGNDLTRTHLLVDGLRHKAMALQQISRLAQNQVRQSHEKLSLQQVVQGLLTERQAEYAAAGVVVNTRFKPVDIIVDPGLLVSLIAAALNWVTEFGTVVRLATSMKNWPQHGQLSLIASQGVRLQTDIDNKSVVNQSIAWHLLQQTALSMGVGLELSETVHERNLMIEFPRTVVALEGMTMMEMDAGSASDSFGSVHSNFIAGHQVLLISSDYGFYRQVRDICKGLSLVCEQAPNVETAERMCEQRVPHLIMCDENLADERYDALLADLERHSPGFPTIMVGEGDHGFELSGWSSSNKSRISRNQVLEQLPSALTIELSRSI